jgi:hypothetical protein
VGLRPSPLSSNEGTGPVNRPTTFALTERGIEGSPGLKRSPFKRDNENRRARGDLVQRLFRWWALGVSNPRPLPCKGETKAQVRGLSRLEGTSGVLSSSVECRRVVMWVLCSRGPGPPRDPIARNTDRSSSNRALVCARVRGCPWTGPRTAPPPGPTSAPTASGQRPPTGRPRVAANHLHPEGPRHLPGSTRDG